MNDVPDWAEYIFYVGVAYYGGVQGFNVVGVPGRPIPWNDPLSQYPYWRDHGHTKPIIRQLEND